MGIPFNLFRIALLSVVVMPAVVYALDHDNLDPNRPIAIEDAYVIPKGEIGVEGGVTFNDRKEGKGRFGYSHRSFMERLRICSWRS